MTFLLELANEPISQLANAHFVLCKFQLANWRIGQLANLILEFKSSFTRSVGQALYAAMIEITTTVEYANLDAGSLRAPGEQLTHLGALFHFVTASAVNVLFTGRCSSECIARNVIDKLSVDVLIATENRQAWLYGRAGNCRPDPPAELLPALLFC
jgi:hypothetical protein